MEIYEMSQIRWFAEKDHVTRHQTPKLVHNSQEMKSEDIFDRNCRHHTAFGDNFITGSTFEIKEDT